MSYGAVRASLKKSGAITRGPMPRAHSLPKRRGLAVAVQLALTFAAGLYAPRIRAQQIACPASGVTVSGTASNAVSPCNITGALTIDTSGRLDNSGALATNAGATLNNNGFLQNYFTINNSGELNN